jgi:uncharacterized SAM-dependent methyltransferase
MHLISQSEQTIRNGDFTFEIREGESILTEYSHKYSFKDFEELVSDYFSVDKIWTDSDQLFSIQYLTSH